MYSETKSSWSSSQYKRWLQIINQRLLLIRLQNNTNSKMGSICLGKIEISLIIIFCLSDPNYINNPQFLILDQYNSNVPAASSVLAAVWTRNSLTNAHFGTSFYNLVASFRENRITFRSCLFSSFILCSRDWLSQLLTYAIKIILLETNRFARDVFF